MPIWISGHAIPWDTNHCLPFLQAFKFSPPFCSSGTAHILFPQCGHPWTPKPHRSLPSLKSHSPQVHTTNFSMLNCSSLYCLHLFHLVDFMKTISLAVTWSRLSWYLPHRIVEVIKYKMYILSLISAPKIFALRKGLFLVSLKVLSRAVNTHDTHYDW